MAPKGEQDLQDLIRRHHDTEARIRSLLAQAPTGNRRDLLTQALVQLTQLRKTNVGAPVTAAYLAAYHAVRDGGHALGARDLSGSLASKLDQALKLANSNSRQAFRIATADNLEDAAHLAVTSHVDTDGKRWTLGSYADMAASTIGRRATSRGTVDAVDDGLVKVSSHGTKNPICAKLEGRTFPARSAPQPPFHPRCKHTLAAA